ncbi:MAG: phosphate acyltransferase PlsX [Chlamydiota bacterium]|nr:phosphate acyltransferase PlsX [Chlamydiota bacterium]
MRIGVDLMGSDCSPSILFEAVLQISEDVGSCISFDVFVDKVVAKDIDSLYPKIKDQYSNINLSLVSQVIEMSDDPITAVKTKVKSSIVKGVHSLHQGDIDAFVTAGNTGALLVSSKLTLPMIEGIQRPALLAILPTKKGRLSLLDVGANTSCKAQHLVQYAMMGAAYQKYIYENANPKIGLLNVGSESEKGTVEHKKAYQLLQDLAQNSPTDKFTFVGNVEGREVFDGKVDVLVTDGFSGNVLLKSAEGAADYLFDQMLTEFDDQKMKELINSYRTRFHYAEHPGALLCGVEGIVIKCHGDASTTSMYNGIVGAIDLVNNDYLKHLSEISG